MSGLYRIPDWAVDLFPDQPLLFVRRPHPLVGDYCYEHISKPLKVICSATVEADGRRWMHVSCSRAGHVPFWSDMGLVKDTFIGKRRRAIQIFPTEAEYVNLHPYVLHLWSCLNDDGLPDFRHDGQI